MKVTGEKIELVAPAGGWDHLKAALNGGADAVYLGYNRFGARAYAQNFDFAMLKKAAVLAHSRGAKIYLTLNTLIKDSEMADVARFLSRYWLICQDGIIIQDLGVYRLIRDLFPHLRLHASTQMNAHNLDTVNMLQDMGIKRVVLAREMTIGQIKHIRENSNMEIEVFAHGSQCYSFSGHCYLSSFASGRSGNRGRCSQPCRMKYRLIYRDNNKFHMEDKKHLYYLSKRDLSAVEILPQIINSGVDALKIEGRMKTPEYVAIVTKLYRKYIDAYYADPKNYKVDEKDLYKLSQIFLRDSGPGYFKKTYPREIINPKTSGSIGNFAGRIDSIEYSKRKKKVEAIKISSKIPINNGDLLEVWTNKGNERITVKKIEKIQDKGSKTLYRLSTGKHMQVTENDRVFKYFDHKLDGEAKSLYLYHDNRVKVKEENRQADLKEYELSYYLSSYKLEESLRESRKADKTDISVSVYDLNSVILAADRGAKHVIYNGLPHKDLVDLENYCQKKGAKLFLSIPRIIYDRDFKSIDRDLRGLAEKGFANFEICNLGSLNYISNLPKIKADIVIGRDINVFNTLSAVFIADRADNKVSEMELSNELNIEEASSLSRRLKERKKIKLAMFGYGYFPVMAARYRIDMLAKRYSSAKDYYLEDIKGYKFRVGSDIWGNLVVFNSKKICTFFDLEKITGMGLDLLRLDMRFLDYKGQGKIIEAYKKALGILEEKGVEKYREFCNYFRDDLLFKDYTRGHLLRGVR
ncbi:MAG: U32 family peptidase [Actinomycetota bacterium]